MYVIRTRTAEIVPFAAHFCDTSPSSNRLGTDFAADLTTTYPAITIARSDPASPRTAACSNAERGDLFFEERRAGTLLRGRWLVNRTLVGVALQLTVSINLCRRYFSRLLM
jgi:hypothetical protein